jgi:hypothetical protein
VAGNILLFFYKKKTKENKKNNKILPALSACCGAVVRNECGDHFPWDPHMDPTLLCLDIVSLLCSVSVRITPLFKYYKRNFIKSIKAKRMSTTAALFDYVVKKLVFFLKN